MKRSNTVTLTAVMLTTAVAVSACGNGVDDRTDYSRYENVERAQTFDYEAEKRLRLSCNKPEDFGVPACHQPKAYIPSPMDNAVKQACDPNNPDSKTNTACQQQATRSASSGGTSHSSFIFLPMFFNSGGSGYGAATSSARSYGNARTAFSGRGLGGMYRASAVPATVSRFGGVGASMARSSVSTIARGGFGGTGRGFAAGAAHGMSFSAGA